MKDNDTEDYRFKGDAKYGKKLGRPSRAWYLAPIFVGIVGGLVGYIAVKDEDRKMAKRLLIIGLIITALIPIGYIALVGLAYTYISGIYAERTSVNLFMTDATCIGNPIQVTLRNVGTESSGKITVTANQPDGNSAGSECTISSIESSKTGSCEIDRDAGAVSGTYGIRATSPGASPTQGVVFCATEVT